MQLLYTYHESVTRCNVKNTEIKICTNTLCRLLVLSFAAYMNQV